MTQKPRYSKEEFAQRGDLIYQNQIRPQVELGNQGKIVALDHGYGVKTRFAHNSQVFVEVGQKVKRYDVLSAVGNTGRSTGPHLHYEVRIHDVPVDPMNYVLSD
jgi:murein DD-endopeptidase MepM/ murein hydrolase activator NlpD